MEPDMRQHWITAFDERQKKEIEFSQLYAKDFAHGTEGHNAKLIIAKMADLLDKGYTGDVPIHYTPE